MATPFPFKTKYVSPLPLGEGWGGASFKENKKGKELFFNNLSLRVVPPGIEPGTQGFSVLCSTN